MTTIAPEKTRADVVLDVRELQVEIAIPHRPPIRPVRGVSFSVSAGQRVGIVGESGSGKSLTALSVMRLLPPRARIVGGEALLGEHDLASIAEGEMAALRGGRISIVYQDPMSSLNPLMTIGKQITEAITTHERVGGRVARTRAIEVLSDVGLPQPHRRIDDHPHQFSGGMRQRVMIAMAICTNPSVLIADEPTTALDVTTQARIMEMLARIVEERRMGVLLITHDLGLASSFCNDVNVMYAGRIVEKGRSRDVLRTAFHPYSAALLDSVCRLDSDVDKPITAIPGQPPLPYQLPGGCTFHPRCRHARDLCAAEAPLRTRIVGREVECHFPLEQARAR
jgi:oligopeptide/dipeptide ABC transporter ATP-binding protein